MRTYLIFGEIEGKLDVLCVECTNCARKGRYHVLRLIEVYGRNGNMSKWLSCTQPAQRCDLQCPDLPKVL
jgi:hypothetical protein